MPSVLAGGCSFFLGADAMDLSDCRVALCRCATYERHLLLAQLDTLVAALGPLSLQGKKILLKPNLISAKHGPLACTHGQFILSVGRWLLEQGASVTLGDSPAYGGCKTILHQLELLEPLARMGILVQEFDRVEQVRLSSGLRVGIARPALECDLLLSLPKVKAHCQTRVTLAVKNFFGCIAGMRKPVLHMQLGSRERFAAMLVDLLAVLPDSISIVDGIIAMHRTGPITGAEYPLAVLAASCNPVAADTALLEILGITPATSPVWLCCHGRGMTGCLVSELHFPLQTPATLRAREFLTPQELAPIRFSLFRFLKGSIRRFLLHWKFID